MGQSPSVLTLSHLFGRHSALDFESIKSVFRNAESKKLTCKVVFVLACLIERGFHGNKIKSAGTKGVFTNFFEAILLFAGSSSDTSIFQFSGMQLHLGKA
jgi:hypothetical protein